MGRLSFASYSVDRGSAAAPGYSFNAAQSSGLFGRADGGMGFAIAGTEYARWEGDGRFFARFQDCMSVSKVLNYYGIFVWTANYAGWTGAFIATVPTRISSSGLIQIVPPAVGTAIPVQGAAARATTANGFNLLAGDVLFAVLTPGSSNVYSFIIIPQATSLTEWPENWIFIAYRDPTKSSLKLGSGHILQVGTALNTDAGWSRVSSGKHALYNDSAVQLLGVTNAGNIQLGLSTRTDTDVNIDATSTWSMSMSIVNAATNSKNWVIRATATTLNFEIQNDAFSSAVQGLIITRSANTILNVQFGGSLVPTSNNALDIGTSAVRVRTIYLVNQPSVSSDASGKKNARPLNDAEINAWGNVSPKLYNLVMPDGTDAKVMSAGLIAQDVIDAFTAAGLKWKDYSLFDQDAEGKFLLKYGECAMFEAAYQRSRVAALNSTTNSLKAALAPVLKILGLGALTG